MLRLRTLILSMVAAGCTVHAQAAPSTHGTLVVVPAYGEVKQANDQVRLTFTVEEQDKDKTVAASRVNVKMKQGADILKRYDPQALLQTRDYYTYPVYPEEPAHPVSKQARQPTGWRVGQYLDAITTNLQNLPKTVAAVQAVLGLNGMQFGLSDGASKKLDDQKIAATYQNLTERIASITLAMGRHPSEVVLDTVDFEGSGNYGQEAPPPRAMMMKAVAMDQAAPVGEPSFEPGETTVGMRVVGKFRFK